MSLPFSDGCIDVVNCCGALHLFTDLPWALGEVSHILKPGGRFAIAALRKRTRQLREGIDYIRQHMLGVSAFRPDELESQFHRVRLYDVRCHYAKGIWLVVSAKKLS